MTNFQVVYDAFLAKILDDEWGNWYQEEAEQDWKALLMGAMARFKFPRVSLDFDDTNNAFIDDLNNDEVQILATYMKCEWLNRNILTWENVKPLYEERDFSLANLLSKFKEMLLTEQQNAAKLEAKYYRSINRKPFDYTVLARQS